MRPGKRRVGSPPGCRLLLGLLTAALASSAGASPIDVFFDGPESGGKRFGTSASTAGMASGAPFDVPIIEPAEMSDASGILSIFSQSVDPGSVNTDPDDLPNSATSAWQIQNVSGRDYVGDVYLLFGAYGTTGVDGTLGGNAEYLITNHWSIQFGVTAFLGTTREHDLTTFARFTTDGRPFSESGFGIGHMQAGGSERNQMNEFWGRIRYRF